MAGFLFQFGENASIFEDINWWFKKKKDYIAYVGLWRKEYEYTFNGVGNYFYCSSWKTDFLKIIMNTMKVIKKHLQKDVLLMKKRKEIISIEIIEQVWNLIINHYVFNKSSLWHMYFSPKYGN